MHISFFEYSSSDKPMHGGKNTVIRWVLSHQFSIFLVKQNLSNSVLNSSYVLSVSHRISWILYGSSTYTYSFSMKKISFRIVPTLGNIETSVRKFKLKKRDFPVNIQKLKYDTTFNIPSHRHFMFSTEYKEKRAHYSTTSSALDSKLLVLIVFLRFATFLNSTAHIPHPSLLHFFYNDILQLISLTFDALIFKISWLCRSFGAWYCWLEFKGDYKQGRVDVSRSELMYGKSINEFGRIYFQSSAAHSFSEQRSKDL